MHPFWWGFIGSWVILFVIMMHEADKGFDVYSQDPVAGGCGSLFSCWWVFAIFGLIVWGVWSIFN
jgi:hypothetical protein